MLHKNSALNDDEQSKCVCVFDFNSIPHTDDEKQIIIIERKGEREGARKKFLNRAHLDTNP